MTRKILLSILVLGLAAYLVVAVTILNRKPAGQTCRDIELVITDSAYAGFITKEELKATLQQKGLYPIGKQMDQISTKALERELAKNPLIGQAQCYKTPGQKVCVQVTQRVPILRVMGDNGDNYYVDNTAHVMPPEAKCVAHRIVATGNIDKAFATTELYPFALFLQNNPFWDAQIEQMHVLPDHTVELVPRVGDHIVYLGSLEHFDRKLHRLKLFYEKALNRVGWNKYSRISLEFDNQIVCTKRITLK
ncbi:MAG: cell division protein FtsQ [Mediterranea sp.]|jgi:cell division protein FtsQ|nr:cell division protein FtsQ [Mediterranea sp.]